MNGCDIAVAAVVIAVVMWNTRRVFHISIAFCNTSIVILQLLKLVFREKMTVNLLWELTIRNFFEKNKKKLKKVLTKVEKCSIINGSL